MQKQSELSSYNNKANYHHATTKLAIIMQKQIVIYALNPLQLCPPSFSNTFPTNQVRNIEHNLRNQHEFILPGCRIELFKKFPLYTFPLAWNNLGDIGFQPNRTTFHFALKDYLLESIL